MRTGESALSQLAAAPDPQRVAAPVAGPGVGRRGLMVRRPGGRTDSAGTARRPPLA